MSPSYTYRTRIGSACAGGPELEAPGQSFDPERDSDTATEREGGRDEFPSHVHPTLPAAPDGQWPNVQVVVRAAGTRCMFVERT